MYPVSHDTIPLSHVTVHVIHTLGQVIDEAEYTVKLFPCVIFCHWNIQSAPHLAYNTTSSVSSFVLYTWFVYSESVYHPLNTYHVLVGSFNSTSLPSMNALGFSSLLVHPDNS